MTFSSDDLPAPLRPIRPTRSPASSESAAPSSRATWPNARCAPESERTAMTRCRPGLRPARLRARRRTSSRRRSPTARVIFLKAGRAGDVDLGQAVADDVEADQQQAARRQQRADALGDLAVARRDRLRHALAAGGEVAADLVALRNARQHEGRRLAGDDEHALVAAHDLRQVALHHHRVGAARVERLDDRAEVHAVGRRRERCPCRPCRRAASGSRRRASAWKRLISAASRVTSVGPMNCGNSRMASFSG